MYVNAFVFGIVATLAALFILMTAQALINSALHPDDGEEKLTEEEYRSILEEMTGKKFRIVNKNGVMVGEPIEDDDDDGNDKKPD